MHARPRLLAAAAAAASAALAAGAPAQTADPNLSTERPTAPGPVEAQRIVVTTTRHAMLATEAPGTLSIVTRRDIEARGAENVLSAVRGETGLTLHGRAIGGRQVLSLRGLDSKHTLFLVDGRRIGATDGVIGHSDFEVDWVGMDDIERIEIVRGPLSVLYGSEALGGVVNVITRQPGDRWGLSATATGSRAEGARGGDGHAVSLHADGPLDAALGLGLRAGAAERRSAAIASATDPRISELEGRDKRDGWLGLVWQPQPEHRVEAEHREGSERRWADARERGGARRYHVTENLIDRTLSSIGWEAQWRSLPALAWPSQPMSAPGRSQAPTPERIDREGPPADAPGRSQALTPQGFRREGAPVSTQLRAYRSVIDVVNVRTAGVAVNPPQRLDDRVLEGQARASFGAQAVTAGFEAHNEALHDPGLPGGRSIAQHRALYLQDEAALDEALRLTLGLRHDRHQLFGQETSPRAYLVWRAGGGLIVKGGVSHGFKAPNLKQIVPGGRSEGPNIFLGNPALRPETSDGAELALGWQQAGREVQLAAFEQRVDDLIEVRLVTPGTVPGTGTYTYENLSRAKLRGLEASLSERLPAGFAALVSYTYLDASTGAGVRLERRPRHSAGARLDWQQGPWRAGLRIEYSADQRLPAATAGAPAVAAPDLTLLYAHAGWQLSREVELMLGVDNLGNVRLAEKSALFQQAEPPRTWRLTLRGRW
ncbi:MAG: TonB-dependent receptor [Rubrivivax sp.]|nr:TonB-dependent receptor [Rubrivivax sp.]